MTAAAPSLTTARTMAAPIPDAPPVISTTLSLSSRSMRWLFRSRAGNVPVDFAVSHDEHHTPHRCDVLQRITFNSDDVGRHVRRDGTDLVAQPQRLRSRRSSADNRVHRRLAAILDAIDKLLRVAAMRTGDRVGPQH